MQINQKFSPVSGCGEGNRSYKAKEGMTSIGNLMIHNQSWQMWLNKPAAKLFLEGLGIDYTALRYLTSPFHILHSEQGLRLPDGIIRAAELCSQLANAINKRLSWNSSQRPLFWMLSSASQHHSSLTRCHLSHFTHMDQALRSWVTRWTKPARLEKNGVMELCVGALWERSPRKCICLRCVPSMVGTFQHC